MDFAWSDEQQELLNAVDRFARAELHENVIENDRNQIFDRAGWKKCGEFGIQGLPVPEEYGGLGMDPLTTVGALERLGYACKDNGLIFSINAHLWTVSMPLVGFGTDEQKAKFLPGLCNGDLIGGNRGVQKQCYPLNWQQVNANARRYAMPRLFHPLLLLIANSTEHRLARHVQYLSGKRRSSALICSRDSFWLIRAV